MNNLFYYLSKSFWVIAAPANFLMFWLLIGLALSRSVIGSRRRRIGRFMLGSGITILTLIMFVPAGHWGLAWLENRIPQPSLLPDAIAGIIMIGGSESENIAAARDPLYTSYPSMNRMFVFTMLAKKYPAAQLVYAGGTTRVKTHPTMRQADIAQKLLDRLLGKTRTVTYERESRTTFENATNAAAMVGEIQQHPWLLVTSASHMPRALGTFRKQGWNIIPMPADYTTEAMFKPLWQIDFMHNMAAYHIFLREIFGMIGYYLGGKSDQLFPTITPPNTL